VKQRGGGLVRGRRRSGTQHIGRIRDPGNKTFGSTGNAPRMARFRPTGGHNVRLSMAWLRTPSRGGDLGLRGSSKVSGKGGEHKKRGTSLGKKRSGWTTCLGDDARKKDTESGGFFQN